MICLNKGGGGLSSSSPSSDADPLTSFFNLNQVVLIDSDLYSNYARHLLNDDDDNKLESISAPSVLVDYKNESLFRFEHALTYKTMSIKWYNCDLYSLNWMYSFNFDHYFTTRQEN